MIYEYECTCGNVQEEIHGMNESPEILCVECQDVMKRLITGGTGIIFKGGGWTTSDSNFKKSMIKKNDNAKKKMIDHHEPVSKIQDLKNKI